MPPFLEKHHIKYLSNEFLKFVGSDLKLIQQIAPFFTYHSTDDQFCFRQGTPRHT